MTKFQKHVFVCVNERENENPKGCCSSKNSLEIMTKIKRITKKTGVNEIRVNKSGCLGNCDKGVACVIYPEGTWYTIPDDERAVTKITNHILGGEIATEYLMIE